MIRRMLPSDIKQINKEYNPDIEPMDLMIYQREFDAFVLIEDGSVISYAVFCSRPDSFIGTLLPLIVVSIGTHPSYRRMYITKLFFESLLATYRFKFNEAQLEVRRSNMPAQKFYISCGFSYKEGCLKDYYSNPDEDAYVMIYDFEQERNNDRAIHTDI